MATVPSTHTVVTGAANSSEMNTFFRDPINYLLKRPAAVLRSATGQSLTSGTWTGINFDAEDLDQDFNGAATQHSTSVNPSRFTANYAGWYLLNGQTLFVVSATGARGSRWAVNGTALNAGGALLQSVSTASTATWVAAPGQMAFLNVGDYVELQGFQSSGGALSTVAGCTASIIWVSN